MKKGTPTTFFRSSRVVWFQDDGNGLFSWVVGGRPVGQIDRRLSTTTEPFFFVFIPESILIEP